MRKRLTRIGNSHGVILPRDVLASAGIDPSDVISITAAPGEIRITCKEREENALLKAYLEVEKKYGRLFKRLAK